MTVSQSTVLALTHRVLPVYCLLLPVCCLQRKLMERNVAEEIAGKVVDSVAQSLEGQKLSSFTGEV